jgi:hypothetical protein
VGEGEHLPRAEVAGEEDDAAAARLGRAQYLDAVVLDEPRDLFGRRARELAELAELPAERHQRAAQCARALGLRHFGEGEFEVAHPRAPQPARERVGEAAEGAA